MYSNSGSYEILIQFNSTIHQIKIKIKMDTITIATTNINTMKSRVLRFEFSSELIEHVAAFANMHQYDDRKTYKEAWVQWLANDEIAALFKTDVARLSDLGYKGDIADKLFKSGRYYFRGKKVQTLQSQPSTKKSTRQKYVSVSRELLDIMDEHIERGLRSETYTPATGFAEFCKTHADHDVLKAEVVALSKNEINQSKAVYEKLKKTYKNRYFMLTKL